jgi:sec-independent protein translocase protein TatA
MGLPNIGPVELIIVLVIALLILGPGKLPEVGSAFGKTIREFRKAATDIQDSTSINTKTATEPSTAASAARPVEPAAPVTDAPRGTPADPVDDKA